MNKVKQKRVMAVASAGGHWTQLTLLTTSFEKHDVRYVTTDLNQQESANLAVKYVVDADLKSNIFKIIWLALSMAWQVVLFRPHVVISTGAAPGFFAVFFARLIGSKTIWVDSLANYQQLSKSGKYAKRFCSVSLSQWQHVSEKEQSQYWGSLL